MTPDQIATRADVARVEAKLDALLAAFQPPGEWLSVADAAARLGCSVETVRRRIKSGEIEARGTGKTRRVRL